MESKKNQIIITNKKIIDFYNKNKHIDFENVNLLFIELLNNITNTNINNPCIVNNILQAVNDQSKNLQHVLSTFNHTSDNIKNDIQHVLTTITHNNELYKNTNDNIKNDIDNIKLLLNNMSSSFISKIYETKDNYIQEFKSLLKSTDNQQHINIINVLDKYNQILADKLLAQINDILPKNQTSYFENIINAFKIEFNKLHPITLDNITNIVENKSNILVQNINDQLYKYISTTENKLLTNIDNIKHINTTNYTMQNTVNQELLTYLNKNKISASKGILSEEKLFITLNSLFPSGEIINTTGKTATGDFILKRNNLPTILFENKIYSNNVNKDEIDKFIRDINKNKCHGIFISQQSGIVGKDNFQIDFHDNLILVYIHHHNNEPHKITLAVNIIDILASKITQINNGNTTIPTDVLTNINNELQTLLLQKDKLTSSLKEYYKKTLEQINDIHLPSLSSFLVSFYANNKKNNIICNICKIYNTDNLRSLARHKHSCKNKQEINTNSNSDE
jgi:ElaB/YqjD/DUF883 family membrane-anchored ribosome-binding protein